MDFSQALLEIKAGKKVRRKNSIHEKNNLSIGLSETNVEGPTNITGLPLPEPDKMIVTFNEKGRILTDKTEPTIFEALGINKTETYSSEVYILYIPSMEGLLADDWYVVE